jgi:glyoxylase I family protein
MPALPVHHVAVVVADLARAERFYAGVLGLPVLRRWDDDAGAPRSVWLSLGEGAFLAVERAGAPEGQKREDTAPGLHGFVLGIRVEEREAMRAHLEAQGFPVERESAYTIYTRDPDGNLIGLSHYPDAAG